MAVTVREKKKGSGEWWIFINHQGKRKSKKIGDKRTANNLAKEIRERLAKGDMGMVKDAVPTLSRYGKRVLESPLNDWEVNTLRHYQDAFRLHIKPALGRKRLDEVKKRHVKNLITNLKANGFSASRAETVLQVLRIILNHAAEDEYIVANPCEKMGKYCGKKPKKKNPLDAMEAQEMVEAASHLSLVFEAFFVVKLRTGLRVGEIAALEWSDVDFENRTLSVTKQWDYKLSVVRPPKKGSIRTVMLTPQCAELLKRLYQSGNGVGLVFPNKNGKTLPYNTIRRKLLKIAPTVTLHDLRHTYATLRIAKGDNVVDVSKQLGHKDINITLKTYTHWVPREEYRQQVDELDNLHFSAPYTHPAQNASEILH